jgi:hypothetical protein
MMFETILTAAAFYIMSRVNPLITVINVLRIFVIQPFITILTVTLEQKNI